MKIEVYPKHHLINHQQKSNDVTTIVRKSPKFSVTKHVDMENSNGNIKLTHSGVYKGYL